MQNTASCLEEICQNLQQLGLQSRHYTIKASDAYQSVTHSVTDVFCLESYLGKAHQAPDYECFAIAQLFDPRYPNLALTAIVERNRKDGVPGKAQPTYNRQLDRTFSYLWLPTMYTAFNSLDPACQGKALLVQSYHARITLADLPQAMVATIRLMNFKQHGQLAQIAADFDDPLTVMIAGTLGPFIANRDVYHLPRTDKPSTIRIPLDGPTGETCYITDTSTALDNAIRIAYRYLDTHYQSKKG